MIPPVGWERDGAHVLWYVMRNTEESMSISAKVERDVEAAFANICAVSIIVRMGSRETTDGPLRGIDIKRACPLAEQMVAKRLLSLRTAGYWKGKAELIAIEVDA